MRKDTVPGYAEWLHSLARRYRASQIKAALAVNSEMLRFYWSLGADIVRLEPSQPWGSGFMQHLGEDIRREIPDAGCFSCGNLYYMRWFFELYCMRPILPQAGGKLKSRKYMLELGQGFCFKGREVPLDMGSEVRPLDMLFYNDEKHFYLVVEVKVTKFEPADVGQTNAYVAAVNHQLRRPGDGPTIGLIVCKEKDRVTAKYSLEGVLTPIGIADYALEKFLPADFASDLPDIEAIETDQTRRLQLLLEKSGITAAEGPNLRHL